MDIESFRTYCLVKPGTTEDFPFDENTIAFRVGGKIYALADIADFDSVNLKCDPEEAVQLREQYDGIIPGYHMNKKHWNTVSTDGSVQYKVLTRLIDMSYNLVLSSLPKKEREKLGG